MDRARLDYARVLISTTFSEVVNSSSEVVIDGCKYVIKLVEEWGCNLGEDAFLSEVEADSRTEALTNVNDAPGLEDYHGEMNDLVEDLNEEWLKDVELNDDMVNREASSPLNKNVNVIFKPSGANSKHEQQGTKPDSPIAGTCSMETERNSKSNSKSQATSKSHSKKKKKVGVTPNHSFGFIKRIARLPSKDRKKILKVKNARGVFCLRLLKKR